MRPALERTYLIIWQSLNGGNYQAGLALGSPNFNKPHFAEGSPLDWVVAESVPYEGLKQALAKDEGNIESSHPLLTPGRSFTESLVVYVGANEILPTIPMDGSHITSIVIGLLPTSRGSVTLRSSDRPLRRASIQTITQQNWTHT